MSIEQTYLEPIYPDWIPPQDHYVLAVADDNYQAPAAYVCDRYGTPQPTGVEPGKPITWEHELGRGTTLAGIREWRDMLNGRYGSAAIFRLVLVEAQQ